MFSRFALRVVFAICALFDSRFKNQPIRPLAGSCRTAGAEKEVERDRESTETPALPSVEGKWAPKKEASRLAPASWGQKVVHRNTHRNTLHGEVEAATKLFAEAAGSHVCTNSIS